MFTAFPDVFHAIADDLEEDRGPGETVKLYTTVAASPRVRPGTFRSSNRCCAATGLRGPVIVGEN